MILIKKAFVCSHYGADYYNQIIMAESRNQAKYLHVKSMKFQDSSAVIVKNESYQNIIAEYDDDSCNTFFYLDPPYLFSTRKSSKRLYKYEFLDSDHIAFLSLANKVKSNCMISHYPCELYDDALSNWRTFDFESNTRQGMRTERLYMNYPIPQILQDYRYLGKDFIQRQQIKRKTQRWLNRLEQLPDMERTALLSAVIAKYNHASAQLLK